jgi:hypothetical protein
MVHFLVEIDPMNSRHEREQDNIRKIRDRNAGETNENDR